MGIDQKRMLGIMRRFKILPPKLSASKKKEHDLFKLPISELILDLSHQRKSVKNNDSHKRLLFGERNEQSSKKSYVKKSDIERSKLTSRVLYELLLVLIPVSVFSRTCFTIRK